MLTVLKPHSKNVMPEKRHPDQNVHMLLPFCHRFPRQCPGVVCNTLLLSSSRGDFDNIFRGGNRHVLVQPCNRFLRHCSGIACSTPLLVAHRRGNNERRRCIHRHFLFVFCHPLPWQFSGISCGTPLLVGILEVCDKQRRD